MVNCPNCGFDSGDSKFCPNCGTKIEKEKLKSICPNCGKDVGESKFCPECGTKIDDVAKRTCPGCGKLLKDGAKFCPYCGWSNSTVEQKTITDKILDVDEVFSGKLGGMLLNNKTMDTVLDKTVSIKSNHIGNVSDNVLNRKYYENIEPVFLEVLDSIDDDFLKEIFMIERSKFDVKGGGLAGIVISVADTPTKNMSHDEAIKFYINILNNIKNEINLEKQKGTFDENSFYKKKVKESTLENISAVPILKALKTRK